MSPDIANKIPVVPAGDHKKPALIQIPSFFNKFCCLRVKETRLFLEINKDRMMDYDVIVNECDDEVT